VSTALKEAAQRLQHDETLQRAFSMARQAALEALATVSSVDPDEINRLQARIAAIDDIRAKLGELIISAPREMKAVR
jgi:hypothetical protein